MNNLVQGYTFKKYLGGGSSGEVFKVVDQKTKQVFACKQILKTNLSSDQSH